jgi:hypothetical protein
MCTLPAAARRGGNATTGNLNFLLDIYFAMFSEEDGLRHGVISRSGLANALYLK